MYSGTKPGISNASPYVVAASAIAGKIVDPSEFLDARQEELLQA
jgi:homoaconitase/3-isopropylmalate dehydratase large subunit